MKVVDLMTTDVETCEMSHTLDCAAQIMWAQDCGCVPIVDDAGRVTSIITDRDICMAALTQGKKLDEISIDNVVATDVVTVRDDASIELAEQLMQQHQIRRIPVVDHEEKLLGIISMADIVRRVERTNGFAHGLTGDMVATTFAAIAEPHRT